jgi:hypothetical protein
MIVGSQEVFGKLMKRSAVLDALKFDVLAAVAKQVDGTLSQEKLKRVIRLFRPDRDGNLSLLEFVKSVDVVRSYSFLQIYVSMIMVNVISHANLSTFTDILTGVQGSKTVTRFRFE